MSIAPQQLKEKIKRLAGSIGYVDCGIASTETFHEFVNEIDRRIRLFPEAAPIYRKMRHRGFPVSKTPWAESLVVCVRWYGKYVMPPGVSPGLGRNYLFDLRNKDCPDNDMPRRMKAGMRELGLRVKTGGVPDRWAAVRSGVARFGRNNFVYTKKYGSWVNIESWMIDKKLPEDEPAYDIACPASCSACVDGCPTGALREGFTMRCDHCVAHLSYNGPEPIDKQLWSKMGHWIYGCDECQLVCPLNRGKWKETERAPWLEKLAPYLSASALAEMDRETYKTLIYPAFWYIPSDNPSRWRRNAARALQNMRRGTREKH